MATKDPNYKAAQHDFNDARAQASMQGVLAHLTGRSNELLSYEEVAKKLNLKVRQERGVQEIPLRAIVGSVGRYTDFTRTFLPLYDTDKERWSRVKAAIDAGIELPPIDVYKVGEAYFVLDGNQRVSVARQEGFTHIRAHVIEVNTEVELAAGSELDGLIIKSEHSDFLERTNILFLRPGVDLSVTIPGQYEKLLDHIQAHHYFMGIDLRRDISYTEALSHWFDMIYLGTVEPIRGRGLLRWFPGRTETDMYLWVSEHRYLLEKSAGKTVSPEAAVVDLVAKKDPRMVSGAIKLDASHALNNLSNYVDQLFSDILVPINGTPESWTALDQAVLVAKKEKAALHGLHIIPPRGKADDPETPTIQTQFDKVCEQANAGGYLQDALTVVHGKISDQICHHAQLADLVVLNVSYPPLPGAASVGSGLRAVIWRAGRPVLTVRGKVSPMDRALLAFNGSPKSKEALFVAAYLSERWKIGLTVLTVVDGRKVFRSTQDYARAYLDQHEIRAQFIVSEGPLEVVLDVIQKHEINLVLIGGYNGTALKEVMLGSEVNFLLREVECPLLICR
jgi:nucleotide-binding universal stress UspA family protein